MPLTPGFACKRDFSTQQRKDMAKSGAALPNGSFPIANEEDLHNAVSLVGMGKDPARAKAHIISRARELGLVKALPKSWGIKADLGGTFVSRADLAQKYVQPEEPKQDSRFEYASALRPRRRGFGQPVPMNVAAINAALTKANS